MPSGPPKAQLGERMPDAEIERKVVRGRGSAPDGHHAGRLVEVRLHSGVLGLQSVAHRPLWAVSHAEECRRSMEKAMKDEPKLRIAKQGEHEFLEKAMPTEDESRQIRKESEEGEAPKGDVATDVGMPLDATATSGEGQAASSNHRAASSSSSGPGPSAPKRELAINAQA